MTHRLEFRPEALASYREQRTDPAGELGKRLKEALERLIDDPGSSRGASARWNSLAGKVWSLSVTAPDDVTWLIVWSEQQPDIVEIHYVGPAPGQDRGGVAWTSGD